MTPGKRLPIPVTRTASVVDGACAKDVIVPPQSSEPGTKRIVWSRTRNGWCVSIRVSVGRSRGHLDLAALDLLGGSVDLVLDVVHETTGGGVADAVGLQVVGDVARGRLAVVVRLDVVVHRGVDALEHRGEDERLLALRRSEVLVGVDADRHVARAGGLDGLEDAVARLAGSVVDDVGALVELPLGGELATGRVLEAGLAVVRVLGEVLDLDLDARVDGLHASGVAGLELLGEVTVRAADEADVLGLRLARGGNTDEVGALLLREGQVDEVLELLVTGEELAVAVDDREVGVGELGGDLGGGRRVDEPDRDDRVEALVGEGAQALLALGVVLTRGGLGFGAGGVEILDRLLHAGPRRVVERAVTT